MTNVNVSIKGEPRVLVKMKDVIQGNWYIVREYKHNPEPFVGKIGCAAPYRYTTGVLLVDGSLIDHEDLVFEEIPEVTITANF